jgi:hypothetical protein
MCVERLDLWLVIKPLHGSRRWRDGGLDVSRAIEGGKGGRGGKGRGLGGVDYRKMSLSCPADAQWFPEGSNWNERTCKEGS